MSVDNILVLGLGVSGRSAAKFLLEQGHVVTAVDQHAETLCSHPDVLPLLELGLQLKNENAVYSLDTVDYVVTSPGISPKNPLYSEALKKGLEVLGEIELACRYIQKPIIAITGTNGKTTVTLLIEHILKSAGIRALALGNVGTPLISKLAEIENKDLIVLELSSFQIETLKQKNIATALILNITEDHLDRYEDMAAYAQAKIKIQENLKKEGVLFVEERAYHQYSTLFQATNLKLYGYSPLCAISTDFESILTSHEKVLLPKSLSGKKSHDLENIMGAFGVCSFLGIKPTDFLNGLSTFSKPKHRVQFIREIKGVSYYDDSKGTNIDAVIRAVETIDGSIILIAGGVDKGAPYTPWIEAFKNRVKCVLCIGQAKEKIKMDLQNAMAVLLFESLEQAVLKASQLAQPNESVLLSPGCSSFDMFKSYAHRGEEFQRLVNRLKEL